VDEVFSAPAAGWPQARHQAPDVMIAASDVEALGRGDYFFVLGEIHPAACTIDSAFWMAQHPNPDELARANQVDVPEARVHSVLSKAWPRATVRTNGVFIGERDHFLESGVDAAPAAPDRVLRVADLSVVERDGQLVVQTADGRLAWEIVAFLGDSLSGMAHTGGFRFLPPGLAHTPRVTVDRLVICRESWAFSAPELPFGSETSEAELFLAIRRWARRAGLPRFVFVRSPLEVKPFFVDFESPVLTSTLARSVRRAKDHEGGAVTLHVEEMVPGVEETWLPDAAGERYTSEVRLVAVDVG
jgi:hypothetical protein